MAPGPVRHIFRPAVDAEPDLFGVTKCPATVRCRQRAEECAQTGLLEHPQNLASEEEVMMKRAHLLRHA